MNRLVTTLFLVTVAISTTSARILRHADTNAYPRYAFKYAVHDPVTQDHKEHWESRNGDLVKGAYALLEPDGKLRVVDYWADDANGFNADVKRYVKMEKLPEPSPVVESEAAPEEPVQPASGEKAEEPQQEEKTEPATSPAPSTDISNDVMSDEPLKPIPVIPIISKELSQPMSLLPIPENYGFSFGENAPPGKLYTSVVGSNSLRWDPKTGSYGGWVPLLPHEPYATIFSKKYIDGKLHEWAYGPITLKGRTLVFKVKH